MIEVIFERCPPRTHMCLRCLITAQLYGDEYELKFCTVFEHYLHLNTNVHGHGRGPAILLPNGCVMCDSWVVQLLRTVFERVEVEMEMEVAVWPLRQC